MFKTVLTAVRLKSGLFKTLLISSLFLCNISCLHTQVTSDKTDSMGAADISLDQIIPSDSKFTAGKLDNGFSYYIRRNTEPSNRAYLRLVINSGSVLEEEDQRGIAHFLEHMAFKGTENFEKRAIIDFMESIGMRIGSGINASTGLDETIYMLQLPTDDVNNLITAFQILRDWATGINFDPEEIDAERKVVIEEWRHGQGAQARIRDQIIPVVLKDSLYAERLPIGTLKNIQNFSRDDFIRFYRDWYRPDLIAIIAVGDFEVEVIENIIREQFESVPAPADPVERKTLTVPEHDETLFVIASDPELQMTQVALYHKFPNHNDWTVEGFRQKMVEGLYNTMLNERFREMSIKPDPPFMRASSERISLVRPLGIYALEASVQEEGIESGLDALLVESERIARFGFTESELERQKIAYFRSLERAYADRESRTSASHAAEMTRAFLIGEPIAGIEYEVELRKRFIPEITLEEINRVGKNWISDSNRVVVVIAPEKPDFELPSEDALKTVLASAAQKEIEPYSETIVEGMLLETIPVGSDVVEKDELEAGIYKWKLANGITVMLKPTEFKKDEIMFTAFKAGGTSLADDDDFTAANTAAALITLGGLGNFSMMDLQKLLTGKAANVMPTISEYEEGLFGSASPVDLDTLFQLLYLRITEPRSDEMIYNILKTQMIQPLANRDANPATAFNDTWNRIVYSNHPRKQPESLEMLDKMDLDKSMAFYRDRFEDCGDFVFIFVGNINLEHIQPLVETYIGGLPVTGRNETWRDVGVRTVREGIIKETVVKGKEPRSSTRIGFNRYFSETNDINETILFNLTAQVLQNRLHTLMRETLGGTYIAQVDNAIMRIPVGQLLVSIDFTSDPERVDELADALLDEIRSLKEEGPTEEEVANVREAMLRSHETSLEQNTYWLSALKTSFMTGGNPGAERVLMIPDIINAATAESVREAFNKHFDLENYIQVTLMPEGID